MMQNTQAEYLKQLGIEQWVPRQPLPSAAPSPEWVFRFVHPGELLEDVAAPDLEPVGPSAAKKHPQPEPHAEQRAIAHIHEALEDSVASKSGTVALKAAAPEAPKTESAAKAPVVSPKFRFAFAKSDRTLFVDQLPVQGSLGFSQHHSRLLAGIARAIGDDPQQLSMPTLVQWPLLAGKTLNQGPEEAFKNVQRQLQWMLKSEGVQRMVLFGESLPTWVVDLSMSADLSQGVHPNWNLPYVCTASLTQALQLPELKRQIWNDLQPLL